MQIDLEGWLADRATNFGWRLLGSESQVHSVKKFASNDHFLEVWRPQPTLEFVSPPQCPADFDGDNMVTAADLALLLGSWGPCEACPADFQVLGAWGMCP